MPRNNTDHRHQVAALYSTGDDVDQTLADLLDMHDRQAVSLDFWEAPRRLIEARTGCVVTPNGA